MITSKDYMVYDLCNEHQEDGDLLRLTGFGYHFYTEDQRKGIFIPVLQKVLIAPSAGDLVMNVKIPLIPTRVT